jgi:hypothetical protein
VGLTTVVDCGGAGWKNFAVFKKNVIDVSQTRVLSFLNIVETTIDQLESKSKIIRIPRKSEMPHNGYRAFDISNFKKVFPEFEYRNFEQIIKEISNEYK